MNNIKYFTHIIILFILQLFVFDNIQLHSYVHINIYILSILILPYNLKKVSVLLFAFLFGIILDFTNNTMGIHAAAATFIAFLRPRLLLNNTSKNQVNDLKDIYKTTGWFLKYSIFLIFIFNVILIMAETFSLDNIGISLIRIVLSTVSSTILILLYYYIAIKQKQN